MLDPDQVTQWVHEHFQSLTANAFVAGVCRYCPDLERVLTSIERDRQQGEGVETEAE
jgi:hypothetical protein